MSNFAPFNGPDDFSETENNISNNNQHRFNNLVPEVMDFSAPNIGFGNIDVNQFNNMVPNNLPPHSVLNNTNDNQDNVINLIDLEDFTNKLRDNQNKLVIIYFTAKWCGPCKSISPYYAELSREFTDCVFLKCDVDDCQDVSNACKISSMPTFIFIKNMNKLETFSGVDKIKLRMVIEQNN